VDHRHEDFPASGNAAGLPQRSRWGIEPLFSDLKSRGFDLEATQLRDPAHLDRRLLTMIMALALSWCVGTGLAPAITPQLSKKAYKQQDSHHWRLAQARS
jgi:hypothetical protein